MKANEAGKVKRTLQWSSRSLKICLKIDRNWDRAWVEIGNIVQI